MDTGEKINILLVDDRPENLISLCAILDDPDYNLVKAESGREALKHLMEGEFALILLDVQMPVLDGFETAALIKQRDRSKHIPIIFVTAVGRDEPFLFKGYDAGAVDYIIKPFEPQILRSKVGVFADLHRKTQQLKKQAEMERWAERLKRDQEMAQRELALLKREQAATRKYKELVDGIHHGFVWAADPVTLRFTFLSSNACAALGIPVNEPGSPRGAEIRLCRDQPYEVSWHDCLHPEDRDQALIRFTQGLPRDREVTFEHRVRGDGQEAGGEKDDAQGSIWLKTVVRLSEKFDGSGDELRGLSVDISDLKAAQETAEQAIRLRDEFLSIASHELKTPLTAMNLGIQNLRRMTTLKGADVERSVKERLPILVERSERQISRLTRLVDELLDVSRINSGKLTIHPERFELSELVRDVCARFAEEARLAGCPMTLELDGKVWGSWDRLRVEQVVTNLVTNGIKYGAGKPLRVVIERIGGQVRVAVRDRGIGIAPEDQARIFSKYERAVSDQFFGGLGLGLYIASQIIEAHGGMIGVESELGDGATFYFKVPCELAREEGRSQDAHVDPAVLGLPTASTAGALAGGFVNLH